MEANVDDHPGRRTEALARLEAVLFAAEEPLSARRLARLGGLEGPEQAEAMVEQLRQLYAADDSGFQVVNLAGGYQLRTRPQFAELLAKLAPPPLPPLSAAGRETLAIIADKQPVTRAEIEAIRGVQCDDLLRQLLERDLIRIVGRQDSLGRPVLYGTTPSFLATFGFMGLEQLSESTEKTTG